ncbi:hypothetical protein TI04_12330 [Achromatium sp. WMS2]|nr:hypothetical protein TI04_12330 [Achromatium sp. WMS2]
MSNNNIVVFSGHIVDRPQRQVPRFPSSIVPQVSQAIQEALATINAYTGYAAAAAGSDILFHEAMQARKWRTHVVLPFAPATFVASSVDIGPDGDWVKRFYQVLEQANIISLARWTAQDPNGGGGL